MENVLRAPLPVVPDYAVAAYVFDNRWMGEAQSRRRRFSFGHKGARIPLLIEPAILRATRRVRTLTASDGKRNGRGTNLPDRKNSISGQQFSFLEACELQGLPKDFLANAPFTKEGKYRVLGNGVPLAMGRALAKAVLEATE